MIAATDWTVVWGFTAVMVLLATAIAGVAYLGGAFGRKGERALALTLTAIPLACAVFTMLVSWRQG